MSFLLSENSRYLFSKCISNVTLHKTHLNERQTKALIIIHVQIENDDLSSRAAMDELSCEQFQWNEHDIETIYSTIFGACDCCLRRNSIDCVLKRTLAYS